MPFAVRPPEDQEFATRTQRASARIHEVMNGHATSLQAPKPGPRVSAEYVPMAYSESSPSLGLVHQTAYQRPRSLSNTSSSTLGSSMVSARDSFESRPPSSSFGSSRTSLDSSQSYGPGYSPRSPSYTHYQLQNGTHTTSFPWQRPAPIKMRKKAQPGEQFAALPGEVLELILEKLRDLHFQPGSISCATCWMRDCCSVAVSARKFVKYAREALYQHIYLVGSESPSMKKRTKVNYGSRLILLRRTLRANPQIAVIVRSLKPPATPSAATTLEYNDLVASVVMACPNLERLVGFYPAYNHAFQRLFQALSTRPRLKEMTWIIEPSPSFHQAHQRNRSSVAKKGLVQEGLKYSYGPQGFLDFHWNWQQLTTLVVHGKTRAILGPNSVLEGTLRCLPSLQNLILSHLPPTAFSDVNLLSLPPLKKLSLSHMPGVTTTGLSSMATRSSSASITTLTLIHINIETLPALARIFSNLTSLETFNIVQAYAPSMPTDEFIWLFPYLASQTLRKLHWDIPYLPTRATMADQILAKSISANGFPSLRILRAPNDPEGVFQSLCRPEERADLPTDRFRTGQSQHSHHARTASGYSPSRPGTASNNSNPAQPWLNNKPSSAPASPLFPPDALMLPRDNSNLHLSRLAAQQRLENARRFPRFSINVIDENNTTVEKYGIGAFLGQVESKIRYCLQPDAGGTDEGGGLVTVSELTGDCGEALVLEPSSSFAEREREKSSLHSGYSSQIESGNESSSRSSISGMGRSRREREKKKLDEKADLERRTREGCTGRWNTMSGNVIDKKDKERWWHTERGRWRGVALS
ncbi:hypothetical protein V8F20_007251 [Naviculisporaceae sp. PSN 640]